MTDTPPRVAVIHTVAMLAERFKGLLAETYPGLDCFHVVDESLLQDLIRHGQSPDLVARVAGHVVLAEKAGASLIVFTCSSTSPAIDTARQLVSVPVVKIDDAMAAEAAAIGGRIGLVCTTPSTVEPSANLIRSHAATAGKTVEIEVSLNHAAYEALMAGDRAQHDAIVEEAATRLAPACDAIVLAQASLAHLAEPIGRKVTVPVLSSPQNCIRSLASYL